MSGLKIQQLPAAFVEVGAKHNALVDVVKTMKGENGITVVASDANIILRGVSTTGTVEGDPVNVVGSDGKLNAVVKHSTWASPTYYPTYLRTSTTPNSITMDSNGLEVSNGTQTCRMYFSAFTKNLAFKEVDVCVAGVSKKMLILASDPY